MKITTEKALEATAEELAALEQRRTALVARRNDLVVKLRTREEPMPTRVVAALAGITNARVTQLEQEARAR